MSDKSISKRQQILLISIAVIIGAQLNMNLFISDFKISIGILMFPVALVLSGKYPVLPVTFLSGAGVFISRVLVYWFRNDRLMIQGYFPELIFYLVYGICFYFYCRRKNYELASSSCLILFCFDYLSNLTELILRLHTGAFIAKTQLGIVLVAFSRSLIIWCILTCLHYYKFSLLKREHAQRYQRLLLLISKLNGEVVWMKKNTRLIEETMNTSYQLFHQLEELQVDTALTRTALNVAKDIHEIKKEYMLILRGLSDALELNLNDEGMYLADILQVLKAGLSSLLPEGKHLELDIQLQENLYTEKHYFLMSVLRNLFNNALEASQNSTIYIQFIQSETQEDYQFHIIDNGPGIPAEDMEQIFSPGFSTKINYETGEINRGLGLNLVQDLIENQWHGTINVSSRPGNTDFFIQIPKEFWKGAIS